MGGHFLYPISLVNYVNPNTTIWTPTPFLLSNLNSSSFIPEPKARAQSLTVGVNRVPGVNSASPNLDLFTLQIPQLHPVSFPSTLRIEHL